jgi:hypothetical protein
MRLKTGYKKQGQHKGNTSKRRFFKNKATHQEKGGKI